MYRHSERQWVLLLNKNPTLSVGSTLTPGMNHQSTHKYILARLEQVNITAFLLSTAGRNIYLLVDINTINPSSVIVECTFQPGYTCTIDYGTDPSYTDLVHRDTSSTQGRMTTINLSQRLREDTTYYYVVSAVSNSHCVRVRGRFRAGR